MRRYLLVALWPAGLAAITAATVVAARRASAAPATRGRAGEDGTQPARAMQQRHDGAAPTETADPARNGDARHDGRLVADPGQRRAGGNPSPKAADPGRNGRVSGPVGGPPEWVSDLVKLGACSAAGGVFSYGMMALLGPPVMRYGPAIDEPVFSWTNSHQVDWWAAILWRLNKVGNTWTTWGAAGAAGACLGVSWRRQRWLPPAALAAAIVVDHYATLALRHTFNRLGPPTSPLGTYPAGGTDRIILFYGLIAHLLWREFSGSPRGKIWGIGTVAALAFNQAYCRQYLSRHWLSDIISGLVYGVVLLLPFMAAIRLIAGPSEVAADRDHRATAP
jgi:hypothetical protein